MTSPDSEPFETMVAGLPADEAAAKAQLRGDLQAQGSRIANTSPFSPFFLLLGIVFAGPVLYLRDLVVSTILPGLFVKTATGALLDTLAYGYDEVRKPAVKAEGRITFVRDGTTGDLAIPVGTLVASPPIEGVIYRMITAEEGVIPEGETSAEVAAVAESPGAAFNLGDGYYNLLPEDVPGIVQVTNAAGWLDTPGADTESDDAFRERLRLKWQRASGWHTQDTYRSVIADATGIDPADVYFDLSAPRGPGSADAYICTATGLPAAALVAAANDRVNTDGYHGLGDDLQVQAIPALPVEVEIQITALATATEDDRTAIGQGVADLIRAAFRQSSAYPTVPRVAPFKRVSRSALSRQIHEAFPLVEAVDWLAPAADPQPNMELPVIRAATLDAAAVVDRGGGKVELPATAHGLPVGTAITIAGTTSYDGATEVDADTTADELVIVHAYTAEVLTAAAQATALVVTVN